VIAALVVTDGRHDYLQQAVASFEEKVSGPIVERWMHDDTGDRKYRSRLAEEFPDWTQFNGGERQGFAGAIRTSWDMLKRESIAEYIFHLEADFTFNRPVDLTRLTEVLAKRPALAQMAFRRQPWNAEEAAAGGIVEQHPEDFSTCMDAVDNVWLEHTRFFTTNPCIYRSSLTEMFDWPAGPNSEGRFGIKLREAGFNFGYWGPREDPPWVEHIGHDRAGVGY
jgi:hypothetical protein